MDTIITDALITFAILVAIAFFIAVGIALYEDAHKD